MQDFESEPEILEPEPPIRKGNLFVAWALILILVGVIVVRQSQEASANPPKAKQLTEASKKLNLQAQGIFLAVGAGIVFICGPGLIVFLVYFLTRRIPSQIQTEPSRGAIYAETFALWLGTFFGISLLLSPFKHLLQQFPPVVLLSLTPVLSMLVLAWPVLRGIPWREVRKEIGLYFGPTPIREVLSGWVTYLLSLPLLVLGIVGFILLMMVVTILTGKTPTPSHPAHEILQRGEHVLALFWAACIIAPITEEIMFRGVLHRHLRSLTAHWSFWLSVLFSACLNGFLFAVIHPQGWLGVPMLAMLAVGFSLGREWRGSLIPCMIAHATHNGLALLIALSLL